MIWILSLVALLALFYWFAIKPMRYWKERGVDQQKNPPWIFGDSWCTITRQMSFAEMINMVYQRHPKARYNGTYQFMAPTLMLRDPELIKQVTVKDFDHFVDHRQFISEDADPLWAKNLFALTGDKWRDMRATLSPAFTSSKMRSMFVLMSECAERFVAYFVERAGKEETKKLEIEMKDAFTRFANDVIASTAFGITCDSLKDPKNEFYEMGKDATDFRRLSRVIKMFANLMLPKVVRLLGVGLFSKAVSDFFKTVVKESIDAREKQGIVRPDMIHLLLEARKGRLKHEDGEQKDTGFATVEESQIGRRAVAQKAEITDLDITAQALIFFFAGFDSVSTLMCFVVHELAINPDIQERLHREVVETGEEVKGEITYEVLLKMKYLDMVVCETLRKWPPAVAIDRICTKPYTIKPQLDHESPVHLKTGEILWVPFYAIHHDPQYYPNPDKFDPERFNEENRKNIKPYTYMPFGVGPRNCIGSRFALLETKTVLYHLLAKFEIVPIAKTAIPFRICKKNFNLTAEDGFWVGLKLRK